MHAAIFFDKEYVQLLVCGGYNEKWIHSNGILQSPAHDFTFFGHVPGHDICCSRMPQSVSKNHQKNQEQKIR